MKTMGFIKYDACDLNEKQELFRIPVQFSNFVILIVARSYGLILQVYYEKALVKKTHLQAIYILKEKFPFISSQLRKIAYMQRVLLKCGIYTAFYLVILFKDYSLAFWGFTLISCILVYKEINISSYQQDARLQDLYGRKKKANKCYFLMIVYSACLILINIAVIFCNTEYMKTKSFV